MKRKLFLPLIFFYTWSIAQIPQTLSYQGLLTDATGAPVPNGSYNVTFNFYTVATGGTPQSRTVTGINTFQGLFTTIIGNGAPNSANAPLNNLSPALGSTQYFIGLQVNNGAELTPRVALTAVPYAFAASTLDANATVAGSQLNSPITNAAVTIPAAQITGTLSNAQYADNSITDAKLATGISATKITGNLPSTQVSGLGSLAAKSTIAAADIADGAVTDAKIATGISATKITGNLPSTQVSGLGSLAAKSAVAAADIADGAVTDAKLATGIDATKITANTLAVANGGTGAATAVAARTNLGLGSLATLSAVTSTQITDGTIANVDIAGGIDGSKIGSGISAANVNSGTLPNSVLAPLVAFSFRKSNAGDVFTGSTPSTVTNFNLDFGNSGSGFNPVSGVFTATSDGWYNFSACVGFASTNNFSLYFQLSRGGVLTSYSIPGSINVKAGSITIRLQAGDTLYLIVAQFTGVTQSFFTDPDQFYFQGARLGN